MSELIQVQNVSYTYTTRQDRAIPALQDITLSIRRGDYLTILGHNGSGKSTLARLLNGLLTPTAGRVVVEGWETTDAAHLRDIRQRVGMIFQSPDNQLIANTVEEDVAFGPENLGVPHDELADRIRQSLEAVGLWKYRRRPPHTLSAGQKQRVAIAGVLAMRPLCLILDEATAMLDPAGRRDVLHIVRGLHDNGTTIVAITHNMEETLQADRVAILQHGRLALTGSPREVFVRPERLHDLSLGLPPVTALAHELHHRHPSFPPDCFTVPELVDAIQQQVAEVRR